MLDEKRSTKKITDSPEFFIRTPETAEEIEHYFRLNAETFRPDEDTVQVASRRCRFIERDPDFQLMQFKQSESSLKMDGFRDGIVFIWKNPMIYS